MKVLKQLLIVAAVGAAFGVLVSFLQPSGHDEDMAKIASSVQSKEDILKEIDQLRIDGVRRVSEGRYADAMNIFLRLIDINHHDQFPYQRLAGMAAEMGRDKFESMLHESVKGKPIALDLNRILGAAYYHARKPDLSAKYIDAFLREQPNDLCATYYKGALARRSGDNKGAIKLLTYVIDKENTYYYAYLELQQAYDDIGQTDMANKMLGLALKNSPTSNKNGICCGLKKEEKKEDTKA